MSNKEFLANLSSAIQILSLACCNINWQALLAMVGLYIFKYRVWGRKKYVDIFLIGLRYKYILKS